MGYHPKDVAEFGTRHGYDLASVEDRKEVAQEYADAGKAPAGMHVSTILWHLEEFAQGNAVGMYLPDGTVAIPEMNRSYAACGKHLGVALDHMTGVTLRARREDSKTYTCSCGERAAWYLYQVGG